MPASSAWCRPACRPGPCGGCQRRTARSPWQASPLRPAWPQLWTPSCSCSGECVLPLCARPPGVRLAAVCSRTPASGRCQPLTGLRAGWWRLAPSGQRSTRRPTWSTWWTMPRSSARRRRLRSCMRSWSGPPSSLPSWPSLTRTCAPAAAGGTRRHPACCSTCPHSLRPLPTHGLRVQVSCDKAYLHRPAGGRDRSRAGPSIGWEEQPEQFQLLEPGGPLQA